MLAKHSGQKNEKKRRKAGAARKPYAVFAEIACDHKVIGYGEYGGYRGANINPALFTTIIWICMLTAKNMPQTSTNKERPGDFESH
jgi:hypothetical protein